MQITHLKRTKRLLNGHLWVFSNEIYENLKDYQPGSIVELYDMQDRFIGVGYINPKSLISIRLLTRNKEPIDREFLRRRIKNALSLRERFFNTRDAFRLVYSEGDYLPGLIVDKYKGCLVLQFLTMGMETLKDTIIELLDEIIKPEVIILRNDSSMRNLEGLTLYKEVVKGSLDPLPVINEDGLLFEIDPYEGQKTGFFLDQRENRTALCNFVKGGQQGLDLFCYVGAWSLRLASTGAEVTGVDSSEKAIRQSHKNAEINSLDNKVRFMREDVFLFLKDEIQKGEKRYDFIVLDPPAFAKTSGKIKEALKGYKELNGMCLKLLKPGGILATSSCSYHLDREMFLDMLRSSGKDAERGMRLLGLRSQGTDHPVNLFMPETEYLKCAFLLVD